MVQIFHQKGLTGEEIGRKAHGDDLALGIALRRNLARGGAANHRTIAKFRRKPKAEGRKIAVELMQQLAEIEGISGIHLMAYKQEEWVGEIVTRSGVLGARKPWAPTHLAHITQSAKA